MRDYRRKKTSPQKWIRFRIALVGVALALGFTFILARAVQLQVLERSLLLGRAEGEYKKALHETPRRGTIYDANNDELAVSIDVSSVSANPKKMASPQKAARLLARALGLDAADLTSRLRSDKHFVWIKRQVTPAEVEAVKKLAMDGIEFVSEMRRFYPMKTLGSQVIGFCGTDGRGLEGLEYYYEPFLGGRENRWTVFQDALGRPFKMEAVPAPMRGGYNLILTLDKNMQHMAEEALAEAVNQYSAKSGVAVVMQPSTGAVLAIAHVPHFNPNTFGRYEPWVRRNRAITDSFEPGSTFKIFLAASALESGRCTPTSEFDCEEGRYQVGRHVINDVHAHGVLSFQDILKYSSNIGAAKIGAKIGPAYYYGSLEAFGFGSRSGVDCPGETGGSLLPLDRWTDMDAVAACFGQGVSVSVLQLASALTAIANDGILMKPYLVQAMTDQKGAIVKTFAPTTVRRVVSSQTSKRLTQILERVVAKGGTGQNAALRGFRVAGKTGTAQKADEQTRGYAKDKYTAAFVGFVPSRNPELVIVAVIDEPKKEHYGGVVAAPVFRRIAQEGLQYLKIAPELVVPEEEQGRAIRASADESWQG